MASGPVRVPVQLSLLSTLKSSFISWPCCLPAPVMWTDSASRVAFTAAAAISSALFPANGPLSSEPAEPPPPSPQPASTDTPSVTAPNRTRTFFADIEILPWKYCKA